MTLSDLDLVCNLSNFRNLGNIAYIKYDVFANDSERLIESNALYSPSNSGNSDDDLKRPSMSFAHCKPLQMVQLCNSLQDFN